MDDFQKVMWSEGMFLTPHHFQQWDRYQESLLDRRLRSIQPTGWGVTQLEVNKEALANGEVVLNRCAAILPDGLSVDVPELDFAPPSRPVAPAFEAGGGKVGVYLASPRVRSGAASIASTSDGDRLARYRQKQVGVKDEVGGGKGRDIAVAVKDLRLLFEGEAVQDFVTLKIAEVERTPTGGFGLAERYVPPCLSVGGSSFLTTLLRRLVDMLSSKSNELASQRRSREGGLAQFSVTEAAGFWFLHTVNTALPPLLHFYNRPGTHPETVYLELARLIGGLYSFSTEGHPKDTPPYHHEDLSETFSAMEEKLRFLMETVIPTRCTAIQLEKTRESLYTGRIHDDRLFESAQFYIAVGSNVADEKVMREVPIKAKVSSLDRVDQLIAQALRGVGLLHLPTPPSEIPVQPGRYYFQVDRHGDHWDAIVSSRTMSIYLPPEFTDLKLEAMAVKE